jgi:lipid-binding SYLF domain-containing protein
MRTKLFTAAALALGMAAGFTGCGETSKSLSTADRNTLHTQATDMRTTFMTEKPATKAYFQNAHAYVIFPSITGGAFGVGAANGQGEVYVGGKLVGTADITQLNVGLQAGAQEFAEVIFFKDAGSYAAFTRGEWEFDAKATASAASAATGTSADYDKGVAVFTYVKGGLMAQAAIGTQKLRYRALENIATEK